MGDIVKAVSMMGKENPAPWCLTPASPDLQSCRCDRRRE